MNFLSFGFTPTAVGDSDSHQWYSVPAGLPRTLVAVPDDSAAALQAGIVDDVADDGVGRGAARRRRHQRAVHQAHRRRRGHRPHGDARVGGPLPIHVEVTTAAWAPVDTVELFANATFDVPAPKGATRRR